MRRLFALIVLLCRGDGAKEMELLVLRRSTALSCRNLSRVRFERAGRSGGLACLSRLLPAPDPLGPE
jgi:hypothetical protein